LTDFIMTKPLLLAGLTLVLCGPVLARDVGCGRTACETSVSFQSISALRSYGLLIAAPDSGCRHVRFRVKTGETLLGNTPPLAPGELAVVRLGHGFPEGENRVTVASVGCDAPPAATRRVVLAKIAPDHGWRAASN
jgi:hypothetical protein